MIIMFVRPQENNNKSEFHNCISPERHQDITKKADHITIVTIKFEKNAYDRYFCCRVVLAPSADNIRLLLNKKKFYVKPILSFLAKFTCLRHDIERVWGKSTIFFAAHGDWERADFNMKCNWYILVRYFSICYSIHTSAKDGYPFWIYPHIWGKW